jgi:hypothetical protein
MKTTVVLATLAGVLSFSALAQQRGGGMGRPGFSGGHQGSGHGGWRGGGHGGRGGPSQPRTPGIYTFPSPGYGGWGAYGGYGSPHGYGNVVFPGTGHAPGTYSPFSITDPSFGARLGATVSGFGYPYSYGYGNYGGTAIIGYAVPYTVPVYVPVPALPVVTTPVAPTQIIYVVQGEPDRGITTVAPQRDSVVTYVVPAREPAPAASATAQTLYLIAFKSHSIYTATEYWLEDDTLHYITSYGAHNQASLDQVDLELTTRLNRERGLGFRLERRN